MAYVEGGDSHESRKQHDFLFRSFLAVRYRPKNLTCQNGFGVLPRMSRHIETVLTWASSRAIRSGAKHFASGWHVWVAESSWLWDGRVTVVGKRKGTHRYIRKVMDLRLLENFRAKRIYSPTVDQ